MKRAISALAALVIVVMVAAPAFAEVQNVRVGGDVTIRGFWRDALRFDHDAVNGVGGGSQVSTGAAGRGSDSFIQSALGLNVSADLTDNVSVDTRLINQRVWGSHAQNAANTAAALSTISASPSKLKLANRVFFPT